MRRRCGFLEEVRRGPVRLVWAHGRTGVEECPKSFVTSASTELVEQFFVWKASVARNWAMLTARQADAFGVLEEEWRAGTDSGGSDGG